MTFRKSLYPLLLVSTQEYKRAPMRAEMDIVVDVADEQMAAAGCILPLQVAEMAFELLFQGPSQQR